MTTAAPPGDDPTAVLRRIRARSRRRRATAGLAVTAAALAAFVASLSVGAQGLGPVDVSAALAGLGTPRTELVVLRLRMPRALTALLVGAALGLAGALFQRVLRNTLASPDVIGVGAGAAVGAVTASVVLGLSATGTSAGAVLGAVAAALLITVLARRDGLGGTRFVLVGVGIGSAAMAVVSYLMITASLTTAQQTLVWLTGSVTETGWSTAVPLALACAVLVPAGLLLARALPRLELGDDTRCWRWPSCWSPPRSPRPGRSRSSRSSARRSPRGSPAPGGRRCRTPPGSGPHWCCSPTSSPAP